MTAVDRISIILPAFNAADTVAEAIDSLETGSLSDAEVIVVNDGSTDDTADILEDMTSTRPWLRVLHVEHGGIVSALNAGIAASRGTLIARMDADDHSLPGRLARQREFLRNHADVGLVGGRVRFGGHPVRARGYAHYVRWVNSLANPEEIAAMRFVESPFAHPAVMFRRVLIDRYGGYREGAFPEDYELWLRWMDAGVRMASIPDDVLLWSDPPDRLSRTDLRYTIEAFYRMKSGYLARWLQRHTAFWPDVIVWGAGRTTRKRAWHLLEHGAQVATLVDIDPDKIGHSVHGVPVIAPEDLPPPGRCFILPYVGNRSARMQIMQWLEDNGYMLERDYLPVA
ncbi:MAG: glycosyltransferase [Bacteroidetes bacterium]|nr:glycosyltransferase [Bacteroidota bacterium]